MSRWFESGWVWRAAAFSALAQLVACEGPKPYTVPSSSGATHATAGHTTITGTGGYAGTTAGASTTGTGARPPSPQDECEEPAMTGTGATLQSGGAAGAGGEAPVLDPQGSATEACLAYGLARLFRQRECAGEPAEDTVAAAFSLDCPDLYFSPGSSATVEGLALCAQTWETFPCENVVRGLEPACAVRGTRQDDEPCAFPAQCQSGVCWHGEVQCGTCTASAGPGEPCNATVQPCDVGYICDDVCVLPAADYTPGSIPTGGTCVQDLDCQGTDLCRVDPADGKVCTARVPLGGSCGGVHECEDWAYCDQNSQCTVFPSTGWSCGPVPGSTFQIPCAPGFRCGLLDEPNSWACSPVRGPEEPCEGGGGLQCPLGQVCVPKPMCSPRCVEAALPGEVCNDSIVCHPGSECRGSVCEPLESQGLFEQWCTEP